MSASAPLGSPSRNIGSVDAVCTSATSAGSEVSVVISHAADTSCIHSEMLAASQAIHSMRKVALRNGAIAPRSASSSVAVVLCLCSLAGALSAPLLLALTFANGIGLAMRWPVFAAIVPDVVTRPELPAALMIVVVMLPSIKNKREEAFQDAD